MFDDDSFVIWLFILAIVISPLLFVARMVFLGLWLYGVYKAQQQAVNADVAALESLARHVSARSDWNGLLQAAHQMQAAVDACARQRGTPTDVITTRFRTGWANAQLELNRFDQLSRERADLHLSDMKSQAASMGLFI